MNYPAKVWLLMARSLNGESTPDEENELHDILSQDESLQQRYELLSHIWSDRSVRTLDVSDEGGIPKSVSKIMTLAELEKINPVISIDRSKSFFRRRRLAIISIAALFLVLVAAWWSYNWSSSSDANKRHATIAAQNGSRSKSTLPDGSVVWLNAGSRLSYDDDFTGATREVSLEGEAFFDIVKQPDRPFIVHAVGLNIKVLGTAFNVKAYPEDKQSETSLIRGSIEVTMKSRPNNKIILSPNEKLIVENEFFMKKEAEKTEGKYMPPAISIDKLKHSPIDSSVAETQWVMNKLVFNDESFEEVARQMERWYDIKIELNDSKLQEQRMTGNFEKETIEQALGALKLMIPFRYEQSGNRINIHR